MARNATRDHVTGQYAFDGDFGRMCRCGHTLGVHVHGGFDCLNAQAGIGPEHTGEPCDCERFRPVRKRSRKAGGVASMACDAPSDGRAR